MKRHKIILIVSIITITALMALKLAMNKKEMNEKNNLAANDSAAVITVTAEKVQLLPVRKSLTKTGVLQAVTEVDIVAATQGKISDIRFDLGTQVKEGQVLAVLDNRLRRLSLEQVEITIDKLEKDSARLQTL